MAADFTSNTDTTPSLLRIGQLARITALSPDTLRVYEKRGLLASTRSRGRFRQYRAEAISRVHWVQNALALGFTLSQLSAFARDRAAGRPPCRKVRAAAEMKLRSVEAELARLERQRVALGRALRTWDERFATRDRHDGKEPLGLLDSLCPEGARLPATRARRFRSRSQCA
jgi:DNA-binding transcriptional MerR regulator